eukprot:scaffold313502_cov35-Tisochrysis_lutea.AAC.4
MALSIGFSEVTPLPARSPPLTLLSYLSATPLVRYKGALECQGSGGWAESARPQRSRSPHPPASLGGRPIKLRRDRARVRMGPRDQALWPASRAPSLHRPPENTTRSISTSSPQSWPQRPSRTPSRTPP